MQLSFSKYQGTGNDFILIDHRSGTPSLSQQQIEKLCHRKYGIGADGLILLGKKEGYDFEMRTFNSDGRECSMCGNGGRTLIQFAKDLGIPSHEGKYVFMAIDGEHEAFIEGEWIHLKMQDVTEVKTTEFGPSLNTGSPHLVHTVTDLEQIDVFNRGRALRHSSLFGEGGTNVNFIEMKNNQLHIRTFERGVEDETLSCGTGIVAAALTATDHALGPHEVSLQARGGLVKVRFEKTSGQSYRQIWLIGPARFVFKGQTEI